MPDISTKSLGELIDQLWTTNMKCWAAQEIVMTETDPIKVADAAKRAQQMNVQRNLLIKAINDIADNNHFSPTEKTYK